MEKNDIITFGNYEGNPVEWLVCKVTKNEALLVSYYILDTFRFGRKGATFDNSDIKPFLLKMQESMFSDDERKYIIGDLSLLEKRI